MRKKNKLEMISAFLRILTLASKFVMTLTIAQFLSLADLGNYGLMASATSFSVYLIGLEIHSFVNREGIGSSKEKWGTLITKQLSFYLVTTVISIPFFVLFANWGISDMKYMPVFILITIVEQFSQEAYRTLIAMNDQFSAALCLFIRSGLWSYLVTFGLIYGIGNIDLEKIYLLWVGFGVFSLLFAYGLILVKYTDIRQIKFNFDRKWAVLAVRHSLIFLIGTMISRLIAVADRFLVNRFDTKENLGIYVFYTSLAMSAGALYSFFGAARLYPTMVASLKDQNFAAFFKIEKQLKVTTILLSLAFALGIPSFIFFLSFFKKGDMFDIASNGILLALIMGAMVLNNYNTTLQYVLYSHRSDKHILLSNIISLAAAVFAVVLSVALNIISIKVIAMAVFLFYLLNTLIKIQFVKNCNTRLA